MGLREQAEADVRAILEDTVSGFGWAITLTDPQGASANLKGYSADIGLTIDPDTGQAVSGRQASVALSMKSIAAEGMAMPLGVSDKNAKPWVVEFLDIGGQSHVFKVTSSMPDRTVGSIVLRLEAYKQ
jgi:hypothetical protein